MPTRSLIRDFLAHDDGGIAILVAFGMAMVIGAAAVAIDLSYAYVERNRLQVAADAAALAGANALPDQDAARVSAVEYASRNMPVETHGAVLQTSDVEIGVWDAASRSLAVGATPPNAVRVTTRRQSANGNALDLFFARALGFASMDLSAAAVAGGTRRPLCLLALDPASTGSLELLSNAGVNANSCDIQVNSTHDAALKAGEDNSLSADRICVSGGTSIDEDASVSPTPQTSCPPVQDPLSRRDPPSYGGCDHNNASYDSHTGSLDPGVYCGGLEILGDSTVTLNPGIYVIKDGDFFVDSNSSLSGDGVGFYLTGGALIHFTSNVQIALKAPRSGDMAGVLFFQDRADGGTHRFDSNNASLLEGTIYLPDGIFSTNSNTAIGAGSAFTLYIAKRFTLDSNAVFEINSDYDGTDVPVPSGLDTIASSLLD